jgi:hypothetical protein
VQLSGVKWGCGPRKGAEVETVSGGLILPEEGEIEEIRVELSLGPICFSKIRPCRPLDIPGPHIAYEPKFRKYRPYEELN